MEKFNVILKATNARLGEILEQTRDFLADSASYPFMNNARRFYVSTDVHAEFVDIQDTDIELWNRWLVSNRDKLLGIGFSSKLYSVGNSFEEINCSCGTSITMGTDDHPMFHSSWCLLKG